MCTQFYGVTNEAQLSSCVCFYRAAGNGEEMGTMAVLYTWLLTLTLGGPTNQSSPGPARSQEQGESVRCEPRGSQLGKSCPNCLCQNGWALIVPWDSFECSDKALASVPTLPQSLLGMKL